MSSTGTGFLFGDFSIPASSSTECVLALTMSPPPGMTCHTSRVPGPAPSCSRTCRGTVVCPLAVMVDSAMVAPYEWSNCKAARQALQAAGGGRTGGLSHQHLGLPAGAVGQKRIRAMVQVGLCGMS